MPEARVWRQSASPPRRAFAADYTEPSPYPISWELDFRHEKPKRIVVQIPGRGNRAYLYLKYSVTNNSNQDQTFLPVARDGHATGRS